MFSAGKHQGIHKIMQCRTFLYFDCKKKKTKKNEKKKNINKTQNREQVEEYVNQNETTGMAEKQNCEDDRIDDTHVITSKTSSDAENKQG